MKKYLKQEQEALDSAHDELRDHRICVRLHDNSTKEIMSLVNLKNQDYISKPSFK